MTRFIQLFLPVGLLCLYLGSLHSHNYVNATDTTHRPKTVIAIDSDSTNEIEYSEVRQYWIAAEKTLKKTMAKYIRMAMPTIMREVYTKNISSECLSGFLQLSSGLKKIKLWAFAMLDASAKIPSGFLQGTLTALGDYQQCLNIYVNESKKPMEGKYCTVTVHPPLPKWHPFMFAIIPSREMINITSPDTVLSPILHYIHNFYMIHLNWGVCIPSQCSANDLQNLIQIIPEKTGLDWTFNVTRCETKETLTFTYTQTAILWVFGVLAVLLTCGTIAGMIWNADNFNSKGVLSTTFQCINSFDVFSNVRKLASYTAPHENLRFVYGISFTCIFWIALSNTFMYLNYQITSNFLEGLRVSKFLFYQIIFNRTVPLQTFFFFSGLLASYKWMKAPLGSIPIWKYLLKRYLRFTPTYLLMIGLVMLVPTWGSGPSWHDYVNPFYTQCSNTWWGNIFYINNFMDMETSCLGHTWMFAVDAQLHLFGLLVLIPLKRKPKVGLMLITFLIVASLLTVALTNVYYDLPPGEIITILHGEDRAYYASHTYFRIYSHFCLYCSGIATGYVIVEKPKFKLRKPLSTIVWLIVIALGLGVICSSTKWEDGILPSPLTGAIYIAFSKLGWAFTLPWISICCANGNGGGLNDYLSWRPFIFLGRLAFIIYIFHPVLVHVTVAFKKSYFYLDQFDFIYAVWANLILVYFLAYFCFLAFEAPFLSLADVIRKKLKNGRTDFDVTKSRSNSTTCSGVMSEKPLKYDEKEKLEDKPSDINKTKF